MVRVRKKENRLVTAIRRVLKVDEMRVILGDASLADLLAVERLLKRRRHVGRSGAPPKYSDAFINVVFSETRHEMRRLRDAGHSRHGPKTAIRSLVERMLTTEGGAPSVLRNADQVAKIVAERFKVYEAARKRG